MFPAYPFGGGYRGLYYSFGPRFAVTRSRFTIISSRPGVEASFNPIQSTGYGVSAATGQW
jgi:hypothetical protein